MITLFIRNLSRAAFVFLLLFAVSSALQAQSLSTSVDLAVVQLTDDYTLQIKTNIPLQSTYQASVTNYAANMPTQAAADTFMEQFERDYTTITVDLPNMEITVTLEMNSTTNTWTVEQWNEHLESN